MKCPKCSTEIEVIYNEDGAKAFCVCNHNRAVYYEPGAVKPKKSTRARKRVEEKENASE